MNNVSGLDIVAKLGQLTKPENEVVSNGIIFYDGDGNPKDFYSHVIVRLGVTGLITQLQAKNTTASSLHLVFMLNPKFITDTRRLLIVGGLRHCFKTVVGTQITIAGETPCDVNHIRSSLSLDRFLIGQEFVTHENSVPKSSHMLDEEFHQQVAA
jgi:hypothetical protein